MANPFLTRETRPHVEGRFEAEEVGLAAINVSLPPEALRYDVTPVGLHYTLSHFDIPALDAASYRLTVGDRSFSLGDVKALASRTVRVTLECAGNGRAGFSPRYPSMPWIHGGVGTADWTGIPLSLLLKDLLSKKTQEVAFIGADRGFDSGVEHAFGRSLALAEAMRPDVVVAWAMNGAPLLPQHGAPLRLVVPGWFGMASVKWLSRIELLERAFDGYQQAVGYHYRKRQGEKGEPIRHAKVKSMMVPPGIPDWYTRRRLVDAGPVSIEGRAWTGGGAAVERVEFAADGEWREARLEPASGPHAWRRWTCEWQARPGEHELACRASDASGAVQPLGPDWNTAGMGNNAVHRLAVTVR